MTLRADTVMLGLFTPDGPDRTRLVFHHYFAGEAASDPAFAQQRQEIIDNLAYVAEQDIGYVKGVQSNLAARDRLDFPTRFSPYWEGGVQHFQKMVVETVQGKARRAARQPAPKKRRAAALRRKAPRR